MFVPINSTHTVCKEIESGGLQQALIIHVLRFELN